MIVYPDDFRILDVGCRTDLRHAIRQARWAAAKYGEWIHRLTPNMAELVAFSARHPRHSQQNRDTLRRLG